MKETKKDLLEKYILIKNYTDYLYDCLEKGDTLDVMRSNGEFDKLLCKYSISDLKRKINYYIPTGQDDKLVEFNPLLVNIIDRKDDNNERCKKDLEYQWNLLVTNINKVLSQLHPWNWYEISHIDKDKVRISIKDGWMYFELHYYRCENRIGDCVVDFPSYQYNFHHETDGVNEITEFAAKESKEAYKIMCAGQYIYNNQYIVEEYCQAMFNYDVETKRIELMFEVINESINTDATLILESAAREAYLDGKLSV